MDLWLNAKRRNAPIHHFERQKFCNENIESIISYSSESLRIINSLEKTYAELRSTQIDVNEKYKICQAFYMYLEMRDFCTIFARNSTLLRNTDLGIFY